MRPTLEGGGGGGRGGTSTSFVQGDGHSIGKSTHPQTEAGPSINKNRSILRLFTIEID